MSRPDHALAPHDVYSSTAAARVGILGLAIILLLGPLASTTTAQAAPPAAPVAASPAPVDLGAAAAYSVLGASTVTNTGNTVVGGELGVSPGTAVTGFPPGVIRANNGAFHSADASAAAAQNAAQAAYLDAQGRTPTASYTPVYDIGSSTFGPGVYAFPSSIGITGTVTLNGGGNPDSVFIFQAGSTLVAATNSTVFLTNGAQAANVFWQVGSSATLKTDAVFAGTIVAQASVSLGAGVSVEGRTLALAGAVTLISDTFTTAGAITTTPTISITSSALSNSDTPTISGTTNAAVDSLISVMVGAQQFVAHAGLLGYWSVRPSGLADGTYPVHAAVSDSVGHVGTDDQSLRIDTVAPALRVTPNPVSNSATPSISGTTDAGVGSVVQVTIDSQALSAVVDSNNTWTVTPRAMADGIHPITATETDEAGNVATASGSVTTDTKNPSLAITSSTDTRSSTPTLGGTTDAPDRTLVSVTVDGATQTTQTTQTTSATGATWSIVWPTLLDGDHGVSVSTTDEAGNVGTATQTLTVDTVAPKVFITSPDISKSDPPTISGTSDNPSVTITVGGTAYPVTTNADGTWAFVPAHLDDNQYRVIATAVDRAGNLSGAQQNLTIDTLAPAVKITSLPLTNSSSPIITGTADGVAGTIITVTVDGVDVTTTLTDSATWSIAAPRLTDKEHSVVVSVGDLAGNLGTTRETLVVDTIAPTLAITSVALTGQAKPTVSGTSDAPVGTAITVHINGHDIPTTVTTGGVWQARPGTLADDSYPIIVTVYDLAGNRNTAEQTLVVDTTAPTVTITSSALSASATPRIAGTSDGPVGSVVTVVVGDETMTPTVDAHHDWAVTPRALADGTHSITVSAIDDAGNTGTVTQELLSDTVLPVLAITSTDHTRDSSPAIAGTTDAPLGTRVTVTVGSISLSTEARSGGTWSVSPGSLADGIYPVQATVSDTVGNVGQADQDLTVDTVAPTVTITSPAVTNDTTPTIFGTTNADVGAPIAVTVNGQALSATASSTGAWSVTATTIPQGFYPVVATVTDLSGNTRSANQTLQIDTTDPAIALTSVPSATVSAPIISGTADGAEGTTVSVSIDGSALTSMLDASGRWSVRSGQLADGSHRIIATVRDPAGNTGTAAQDLVVDTAVAPAARVQPSAVTITSADLTRDSTPTISGTSDAPTRSAVTVVIGGQTQRTTVSSTGTWSVAADRLSDGAHQVTASVTVSDVTGVTEQELTVDTTAPVVSVTSPDLTNSAAAPIIGSSDAAPGTPVVVSVEGQVLTANVGQNQSWTVTPLTLADGLHTVVATVSDPAGNTGQARQSLTVDTTRPVVSITSALKTNEPAPTIAGETDAPEGSLVTVSVDSLIYTATVSARNTWSIVSSPLTDGDHDITASTTDLAGNTGTTRQILAIDTTAPGIDVTSPRLTDDSTPTISGTSSSAQGSIVTVFVNRTQIRTVVSSDGAWAVRPGSLADGDYSITASVSDAAGNVGEVSQTLTVDTTAPIITITSLANSVIAAPTLSGTTNALPFSTVTVVIGTEAPVTAVVDWSGNWSVVSPLLTEGNHPVVAATTDPAGNTGTAVETLTVQFPVIDPPAVRPGAIPVITITSPPLVNTSTPTVSGTTDAPTGSRVNVLVGARTLTAFVKPDATWSVVAGRLADGDYAVSAVADNAIGESLPAVQALVVDTTAPALAITSGALSNESAPTITGTTGAAPGSVVNVIFDTTPLTTIVTAGQGWSVSVPTSSDGQHGVTATVVDPAGNIATADQALTIDTRIPGIHITSSGLTNNTSPAISGTSDVGPAVTVTVSVDGTSYVTSTDSAGGWTITARDLDSRDHDVIALVTSRAGNNGRATQTLVVDTVAPLITFSSTGLSGIAAPVVTGTTTAPVGATVTVTIGQQSLTAPVLIDGTWSAATRAVADDDYAVKARVTDAAGNVAEAEETLSVNTVLPLITVGRAVTIDGSTPSLSGTSNAPFGSTVMIIVNGETLLTTVTGPVSVASVGTGASVASVGATTSVARLAGARRLTGVAVAAVAAAAAAGALTRSWTVHPAASPLGIYDVRASVRNAYGNVGTADGSMTISIVPLPTLPFDPPMPTVAGLTPGETILAITGGTVGVSIWGVLFLLLGALFVFVADHRRRLSASARRA